MSEAEILTYIPEVYFDEVCAPPRATPDAWIVKTDDGFFIDQHGYDDDETDAVELIHGKPMKFYRLVVFPPGQLTIDGPDSYSVTPPMPADAEIVRFEGDAEPENIAGSVSELVALHAPEPGVHAIEYYSWLEELWTFDAEAIAFVRGAA